MYLSLNWVKEWLKLPKDLNPQDLANALTMSTVEVEEIIDQSKNLENVVVGKIKELSAHPQADRLQVCQVDLGESTEQIVCGGSNLSKGMLVAVAKVGSRVKWHGQGDLVTLASVKIRGIESKGMIAASSEIALADLFPTNDEKEILDLTHFHFKVGQNLSNALDLNDIILDIDNKSINHRPDLWGQYGLARELAAIYRVKLNNYLVKDLPEYKSELKLKVDVEDKTKCFRYLSVALKNITVAPSPWWLKNKLKAVGIRSINNIVDITNYVMYELGQPMHAFDAQAVAGHHIFVKNAKKGDKFVTLDGVKRRLTEDCLMIADSEKYLAVAGVMGGQNSEINSATKDIILEVACFKASSIRKASQVIALRSESSSRFEKSLDPRLTELALQKAVELILNLNEEAYLASSVVDIDNNPFESLTLEVPEDLINARFGQIIPTKDIKDILTRLQFGVDYKKKIFTIQVPSFRATKDISIPEDIVEEVARIYGYDNLTPSLPQVTLRQPILDVEHDTAKSVRFYLALSQGYNEVYTYPFTDMFWVEKLGLKASQHLKMTNTLTQDLAYLNLSLLPNLLAKAEENLRFFKNFKIFELERTFDKSKKSAFATDASLDKFLPLQNKHLSGLEVSANSSERAFLQMKGTLQNLQHLWQIDWTWEKIELGNSQVAFQLKNQGLILGTCGIFNDEMLADNKFKVKIAWWDFDFSTVLKYISQNKFYQSLAKFPSINRDLAILIDKNVLWEDLEKELKKVSPLLVKVEPFDVFTGSGIPEGKKSLAFHLEFKSADKTLESEDADNLLAEIKQLLNSKFSAILRQ